MQAFTFGNAFLEQVLLQVLLVAPLYIRPLSGVKILPSGQGVAFFRMGIFNCGG